MTCHICKNGQTQPGKATLTLRREGTVIMLENVAALICNNCGHYYLDSETAKKVMKNLDDAVVRGTKFEIAAMQAA